MVADVGRLSALGVVAVVAVAVLAACGSATTSTGSAPASSVPAVASSDAPGASLQPSVAAPTDGSVDIDPTEAPADSVTVSAKPTGGVAGPCELLTVDEIQAATGVAVPDGVEKNDEARQVQMCTWTATEPFTIVAASLTSVGAEEAFKTNVDLAPAYFDGDAVDVTVPGTDKAYAVQQPDVGWVIGAIAGGQFLQIQVGGNDITQEQVAELMTQAAGRMTG